MKVATANPKEVAEEAFWLAWKAAGGPSGMGFLQDNPGATKDEVLSNARYSADYPLNLRTDRPSEISGDYVFGRMVKLTIQYDDAGVTIPDDDPRPDYQGWSVVYPTYSGLVEAAILSLEGRVV